MVTEALEEVDLEIRKTRTTPLHSQYDKMVERHNKTINQYLSMFVNDNQINWNKLIPLFTIPLFLHNIYDTIYAVGT